jgi:hypothetical protein
MLGNIASINSRVLVAYEQQTTMRHGPHHSLLVQAESGDTTAHMTMIH